MDQETGALTTAIAIVSGANPVIAGAVGIIGGIFGGWWSGKRHTKADDQLTLDAAREIIKQQNERDEARKNRASQSQPLNVESEDG